MRQSSSSVLYSRPMIDDLIEQVEVLTERTNTITTNDQAHSVEVLRSLSIAVLELANEVRDLDTRLRQLEKSLAA
jgi:uncharacterized protein YoxC